MNLRIMLPTRVLLSQTVEKVTAESEDGCFCLLPRHIDFVAPLVPGLLSYLDDGGKERFVAVDEGLLVKQGADVLVSTRNAVAGDDLERLHHVVEQEYRALSERERRVRTAAARIEAHFLRRFVELGGEHAG